MTPAQIAKLAALPGFDELKPSETSITSAYARLREAAKYTRLEDVPSDLRDWLFSRVWLSSALDISGLSSLEEYAKPPKYNITHIPNQFDKQLVTLPIWPLAIKARQRQLDKYVAEERQKQEARNASAARARWERRRYRNEARKARRRTRQEARQARYQRQTGIPTTPGTPLNEALRHMTIKEYVKSKLRERDNL